MKLYFILPFSILFVLNMQLEAHLDDVSSELFGENSSIDKEFLEILFDHNGIGPASDSYFNDNRKEVKVDSLKVLDAVLVQAEDGDFSDVQKYFVESVSFVIASHFDEETVGEIANKGNVGKGGLIGKLIDADLLGNKATRRGIIYTLQRRYKVRNDLNDFDELEIKRILEHCYDTNPLIPEDLKNNIIIDDIASQLDFTIRRTNEKSQLDTVDEKEQNNNSKGGNLKTVLILFLLILIIALWRIIKSDRKKT